MIYLLSGENSFEVDQALRQLTAQFDGTPELLDGTELSLNQLPDLLMGVSLFADKRLVVVKNLSANTAIWSVLPDWLERISDDIVLVLVEAKPDKRTKTYKALQKVAEIRQFDAWKEWDTQKAEVWASQEAMQKGLTLSKAAVRHLVARTGADQWRLHQALEKLAVLPEIDEQTIDDVVELHPSENAFQLLDTALRGDMTNLTMGLRTLRQTMEPHALLGLLAGQVFQLVALRYGEKPAAEIAKDIGVNAYGLQKLHSTAMKLSRSQTQHVVRIFADADSAIKRSLGEPWTIVEAALFEAATVRK